MNIHIKLPHHTSCSIICIIRESKRNIVYSAALCSRTSGGEGCGKRWPDRCEGRKGEMRWYVPYTLATLFYGLFPGEAVEIHIPDSRVNKFPSDIICRRGERRLSQDFGSAFSLCRRQQAWRGQPLSAP